MILRPAFGALLPSLWFWCTASSRTFHNSYGLTIFGDTTQFALIAFSMIATALNAARTRGTTRTFWALMTAGCALWLGAQSVWMLYEWLASQST